MGFVGLVQFSLQCFDVLAWPLLSLVYPLCCSIRAIEANSVSDSQKLNTYWVVFSLILLFEHAFMKLLKWLPLWPYFRLIIVFWLVIPHFGGAFYVYKHLICPCLSTDLKIVVNWFNKQKKSSFNSDNVFTEVERYAQEKGPEALEKVAASKSERTKSNPDAKEFKAVSSLENREVSQAEPNLTGTENSRFPSTDIKEKAIGIASEGGILNIPPSEKVQEWTSAVSQVTTQSDTTFNSYPDGKIHEAVYEKLKIENKAEAKLTQMKNGTFATMETQEKVVEVVTSREVIESALQVQKEWTCALCQLTTQSEATLNSHLQGRKHKAACVALKAKSQPFAPKIAPASTAKESNQPNKERGNRTTSSASKQKVIVDEKVQSQKNSIPTSRTKTSDKSRKEPAEGASINGGQQRNRNEVPSKKDYRIWCKICNVHCPGEIDLASHISGRKHEENVLQQQQKANSVPRMNGPPLWCKICNVGCYTELDMVSHRNGRRHLDLESTGM
ncbi:hypothetical protein PRUPE_8G072900 [Prunus persica]|uniref:HVA22-like protein n=2 Tax=Prunus persica TaxID=3760 RepID=M5VHB2_PRUPE|nr:uncharacterized protein LOC18767385 [Prunus persica]ONH90755.1 hypothetical protein PRUPE_8G072900 [Prunus persica]